MRNDFASFRKKLPTRSLAAYDILTNQFRKIAAQPQYQNKPASRKRKSLMSRDIAYRNVKTRGQM